MSLFAFAAAVLALISIFGIINELWLGLPRMIALMAGSLILSGVIMLMDPWVDFVQMRHFWNQLVAAADLPHLFLNGLLAFMLFAGSLHVEVEHLRERKWAVLALAVLSTSLATIIYGYGVWLILARQVPLPWCLTLGAVLAPTDPIAVGGLLRQAGLPPPLLAVVDGESLFNDGVSVVLFSLMLEWANGHTASPSDFMIDLLTQAGGGVLLGLVGGYVAYRALRLSSEASLEMIITLALVTVTYAVAQAIHVSGPLAVVVAGLLTGHRSTRFAMTDVSREQVVLFWDLVDELLNAMLFLLMGFELLSVEFTGSLLLVSAAAIVLSLLTRFITVAIPAMFARRLQRIQKMRSVAILTWGGLRGGISVALALTLEPSPHRGELQAICYAVVVWTILVQGLTMPILVRRLYPPTEAPQR